MLVAMAAAPAAAWAQSSPFETGANSLVDFSLALATPIAIIVVMVLGAAAVAGKMAWGWCIGALVGIAVMFGSPQIVAWVRGMFGV